MKEVQGDLDYELWTVRGTFIVHVHYDVQMIDDQMGSLKVAISGEGDHPEELETEEVKKEIINEIMKDAMEKVKEPETLPLKDQFLTCYGDWGAN